MSRTTSIPLPIAQMVGEFQCSGCTVGGADTMDTCGDVQQEPAGSWRCNNHSAGTIFAGIGKVCLGLPKGFNRVGLNCHSLNPDNPHKPFRLWGKDNPPTALWDKFNVPVWAMVQDGFLFVRTYCPRINYTWVDVVEGGTLEMVPDAINVGEFIADID